MVPQINQLSKREREVFALLLQGKSNKQIALLLGISGSTVEFHVGNILAKLKVRSRAELISLMYSDLGRTTGSASDEKLGESIVDSASESPDNSGTSVAHSQSIPNVRLQGIGILLGANRLLISIPIVLVLVALYAVLVPFREYQRECENPAETTVGQTLQRSNASGGQVHGQFGAASTPPWQPKSGSVSYSVTKVSLASHWYLKLRYSKYSPPSASIRIFLDNEPVQRATLFPIDQGSWDQFVWTEPIDLGGVSIGQHSLMLYTDGQVFGVADLDQFILTTEPPSTAPAR